MTEIKTGIPRKDVTGELSQEMYMRQKVWKATKMADGSIVFPQVEQSRRYNLMAYAKALLEVLSDKEYFELQLRIDRRLEDLQKQKTLS